MDHNLGNLIRTVRASENLAKPKPLGKLILSSFVTVLLPMLLVGFMSASLMEGAGLGSWVGWVISLVLVLFLTAFMVWVTGKWTKRYAEEALEIHEFGVCGIAPASAFKSRDFAMSYSQLQNAVGKKNRLSLIGEGGRVNLIVDDAESLAAELRQRCGR